MNGSADCQLSSPTATDEEPPGPLDLPSSILPPDWSYADDDVAHVSPGDRLAFLRRATSASTPAFRQLHFPDVATQHWNDWRWQSRHRIRTLPQLEKMLRLSVEEREALV